MTWQVLLKGESFDLEELSKVLHNAIKIEKMEDGYYLIAEKFNGVNDESTIRKIAREILSLLNGSIKVALDARSEIEIADVVGITEAGIRQYHLQVHESVHLRDSFSITVHDVDGAGQSFHPGDAIKDWIEIGQSDQAVQKALKYLSGDVNSWFTLYHVYEIIRDDIGNEKKIYEKGFTTKSSLKRFTRTANSPTAVGGRARHAIDQGEPPTKPMSLSEAKSFIKSLFQVWVDEKQ